MHMDCPLQNLVGRCSTAERPKRRKEGESASVIKGGSTNASTLARANNEKKKKKHQTILCFLTAPRSGQGWCQLISAPFFTVYFRAAVVIARMALPTTSTKNGRGCGHSPNNVH